MQRLVLALCVLPALLAATLEFRNTASPAQVAVDMVGAAAGTSAAVYLARDTGRSPTRTPRVLSALAVLLLATVAVGYWPGTSWPWAMASTWVAVVAAGAVAAAIVHRTDALLAVLLALLAVGSTAGLADRGNTALIVAVPTVTAVGMGLLVRAQRQRLAMERSVALADERAAMARELHDVIAHEITGIVVFAQATQAMADENVRPALVRIEDAGKRALADIRAMVATLHTEGSPRTDTYDLDDLVVRFRDTVSANVTAHIDPSIRAPMVADAVLLTAHRILSEAFTNVRRHAADATQVDIEVRHAPADRVEILVCDNGTGAAGIGAGGGFGLRGLTERVRTVGGQLSAGPRTDGRWQVRAILPIHGKAQQP